MADNSQGNISAHAKAEGRKERKREEAHEKLLRMYREYYKRFGDHRPVILNDKTNDPISKLIKDCCALYGIQKCNCCDEQFSTTLLCEWCVGKHPIPCDSCKNHRLFDDLTFDQNGKSTCLYCQGDKEFPNNNGFIDSSTYLIRTLIYCLAEVSGFNLAECGLCHKYFAIHRSCGDKYCHCYTRQGFKCLSCKKERSAQCSHCKEKFLPSEVEKCDQGDCLVCKDCSIVCPECDKLQQPKQCQKNKKCGKPMPYKKACVQGRKCDKCDIHKDMVCNSYSNVLVEDNCPHVWCNICEIHNPILSGKHSQCRREY